MSKHYSKANEAAQPIQRDSSWEFNTVILSISALEELFCHSNGTKTV